MKGDLGLIFEQQYRTSENNNAGRNHIKLALNNSISLHNAGCANIFEIPDPPILVCAHIDGIFLDDAALQKTHTRILSPLTTIFPLLSP